MIVLYYHLFPNRRAKIQRSSNMVALKYYVCVSFYLLVFLLGFLSSKMEADPTYSAYFCGNETYNSTTKFHNNLDVLLASLTANASQEGGYYMTVMGFGSTDAVNGLFLCRGDVSPTVCQDCVSAAAKETTRRCPNQTEAVIWYTECMLRYTNHYFASQSVVPGETLKNGTEISGMNAEQFNQSLFSLLNGLVTNATESGRSFAAGEESFTSMQTLYALEQCTKDISAAQCKTCLENAIGLFPGCCGGQQGATVLLASCNIRYELYPFYNLTAISSAPPSDAEVVFTTIPYEGKSKSRLRTIVIIVVAIAASVLLFGIGCYFLRRRSRRNFRTMLRENFGNESNTLESLQFSLATIEASTNKFSVDNRIGHGGFGAVYKGILPDGREIAVKRLSRTSGQGSVEFKNEILLIAKLQHRNLVALLGFCLEAQEKMLIYEYVPNKSLDHFLFDPKKRRLLNWFERCKIIGGIARGILYLHEHSRLKVIHRDLKPSNVLLDDKMNPKISDFGMARIVAIDQGQGSTNRIVGTYGYMSPEYAMHGQFSEKSDVFSFGVMVLEIVSGRRNARNYQSQSIDDLLSYSWRNWRAKTPLEILDPALKESYNQDEVIKCIQIGLLCVQENPEDRPMMAEVVSYLNSHTLMELPLPREAFFMDHVLKPNMVAGESSSDQSTNHSVPSSVNDVTMSKFYPR